jgi:hypothetical protein
MPAVWQGCVTGKQLRRRMDGLAELIHGFFLIFFI